MEPREEERWILLIHQIPPKPNYFRVKIWRRLQRLGAVAIKNSVYVLPKNDQTLEDFQWVLREVLDGSGEALLCEARFIEGLTDEQVIMLFHAARDADYAAIEEEARTLLEQPGQDERMPELEAGLARLRRRLRDVTAIDFFQAPGRKLAELGIARIVDRLQPARIAPAGSLAVSERTWVTREGIQIDRMASAWLIRRFIDPLARFKFVPGKGYRPEEGELRFDMFAAEFTHEGNRCTFEVLIQRFGLDQAALRPIAEIIHDIDLKDEKFARPEAAGIEPLITGITLATHRDPERLERASALLDDLYAYYNQKSPQK